MSFKGKVVIVTGASSGIGAATARQLAAAGADLVAVGRNQNHLNQVAMDCATLGKMPLLVVADLTKKDDVKRVIDNTINQYGKLDVLINCAGFGSLAYFDTEDAMKDFDRTMDLNLRAVVNLTHAAEPHLAATKGNVVNVSSVAAINNMAAEWPNLWSYCVAKAGVDQFTRCIAWVLAPKEIRVNSVNPGPVRTRFLENVGCKDIEQQCLEKLAGHTVLNRVSEPEEVADVIVFLASDKAKGVTGASWLVDNGYDLC
ncbi:hypothetical protein JYU34_012549 [Plutella xylostella]|uniref:Ketoreductase domain-containing protein n=1 Tax=Plutella xylostella TaxID=51655 RepID=A0ABQ7QBL2_PLUXY|nr:hypothetical protein JYU34_012549 [Plutella xylostella]